MQPSHAHAHALSASPEQSRATMAGMMRVSAWWIDEAFGLAAFLPMTCFFLACAWRLAAGYAKDVRWLIVTATFSPMLLNLVAFDRYRWLTMMALNSALCALGVAWFKKRRMQPLRQFSAKWRRAAVLLLAVNLATGIGLFVGHVEPFPFHGYLQEYRESRGHRR